MQLFYSRDIHDAHCTLPIEESRHCVQVLRMKKGDSLWVTDGRGTRYKGILQEPDKHTCRIAILGKECMEPNTHYNLHVAIAPTKNSSRFEWFLEKATEIGVDRITPLICERSTRSKVNEKRMQRIMLAAIKQAGYYYLPVLDEPQPFAAFIGGYAAKPGQLRQLKFIAHCNKGNKSRLSAVYQSGSAALMLIGPEGDFSEDEIARAESAGFHAVSLGDHRLRTETAGLVTCQLFRFLNEH